MNKMKLCKTCKNEIAKSAKVCPHCGAKQSIGIFKKLGIAFGILIVIVIIAGIVGGNNSDSSNSQSKETNSTFPDKWNTSENDLHKNGNMTYAVNLIKKDSNVKSKATSIDPATVAKCPFKYYGQAIRAAGTINDIQDYAPGADWSKNLGGGQAGQIVIKTDDGTLIDMFVVGTTGNLKKDDYVILYGYPIGLTKNDNSAGGKTTELGIVGNSFDKADSSTD